jgi:mannan endo-1,4-beta-mannosidase
MIAPLALLCFLRSDTVHLNAADARLIGAVRLDAGRGFVTGFTQPGDGIEWTFNGKAGIYDLKIGYRAGGQKGFDATVDGHGLSGMFPASGDKFSSVKAGRVELVDGTNRLKITKGWGYYDIDYAEFTPAAPPIALKPVRPGLTDTHASPEARRLMAYLRSVYGKKTLSGQYDESESAWVKKQTGMTPAILGCDLMDFSPSRIEHGSKPGDAVDGWIESALRGQILTISWHWNAPAHLVDKIVKDANGNTVDESWYKGFYTNASTFDVAQALADPSSQDYKLILRDIDAIAIQLKKLSDAHIPVLWRPLHEAEGGWFWWGAKGPEPYKKLYRLLFDRLTNLHGLHNLIWVHNSVNPAWYPGDDVVDIQSTDQYPSDHTDPLSSTWDDLFTRFNGNKPVALAEFPGAPDVPRMFRFGVRFLYFVSWTGDVGPKSTAPAVLKAVYHSDQVVTAESLPGRISH